MSVPETQNSARTPVLVIGEEDYLAERQLEHLVGEFLSSTDRALNLDVVDGGAPVAELLTRLDTAPFFGPRRVVVVKRLEAMREADHEALVGYLERGDSPTIGLFVAKDLDRRRRLFLVFKRLGRIVECRPPAPRERPAWVMDRFAAHGKQASQGVAERLVALAGGSLRELENEVAKVSAYVGDSPHVTASDVEAIASRLGEASIFRLVDALGMRDASGAVVALSEILSTHEPLWVLFMVARQYRLIGRANSLAAQRVPSGALPERLGVHPFVARKVADQARRYRPGQFPQIFEALEGAERSIKTGMPPRLVLEALFVRLCLAGGSSPGKGASVGAP